MVAELREDGRLQGEGDEKEQEERPAHAAEVSAGLRRVSGAGGLSAWENVFPGFRGREQLAAEVGVRDADERHRALPDVLAPQVGDAVLGDDVVDVAAARDDARALPRATGRMRLTVAVLRGEGSAMMGLPPLLRAAPRMKSTWPPMPEKKRPPSVSAATWPVRSTASAELIATIWSLRAIMERVVREARGAHLDRRVVVHPVVERARAHDERGDDLAGQERLAPAGDRRRPSTSASTPSESISVWMPRSLRSLERASTASGMRPMPICSVAPSGIRLRDVAADLRGRRRRAARTRSSGSGSSTGTRCAMRSTWRNESPSVRGICGLTSAMTSVGRVDGRADDVDGDAEAHVAVRVGRAHLDERDVDATRPLRMSCGISDRKTGMKSARPSCTASRTFGPMKNAVCRKRSLEPGAT